MRILVSGGGTGGHINPALAIADRLKNEFGATVEYVGVERGLEATLVPKAGYKIHFINHSLTHGTGMTIRDTTKNKNSQEPSKL